MEVSDGGSNNANSHFHEVKGLVAMPSYYRDSALSRALAENLAQACASLICVEEIWSRFPFYATQEWSSMQNRYHLTSLGGSMLQIPLQR